MLMAELVHRHIGDAARVGALKSAERAQLRRFAGRSALAVLAAFALVVAIGWLEQSEQRAVLALPQATRVRIYKKSLNDMTALCGSLATADSFTARCREKAAFLAQFPECHRDCRTLIEAYLPKPVR